MTPAAALRFNYPYIETQTKVSPLVFRDITLADIPAITRILSASRSMTCDYTVGGIFMWIDYFRYKFCIYHDTLFITGVEENNTDLTAFSLPIGSMPLPRAIDMLKDYCREKGLPLRFSAIPADKITLFTTYDPNADVEELADWSDYVYEASSFATLSGKKMAKKRNHVNKFMADHPEWVLEPLSASDTAELEAAMKEWNESTDDLGASKSHDEELREVVKVLENLDRYPFAGAVLREKTGGRVVAFSLAEVIDDMAFVHIEKMDHRVAGSGETIAHLFAARLMEHFPEVRYLNREEDCGDEGLRRAKESWHPAMLLRKYNVTL